MITNALPSVLLTVYHAFLAFYGSVLYTYIFVYIFCLSFLLFRDHVPEIKID